MIGPNPWYIIEAILTLGVISEFLLSMYTGSLSISPHSLHPQYKICLLKFANYLLVNIQSSLTLSYK